VTVDDIRTAFLASLHTIPRVEEMEEKIVSDVISLERRIVQIQRSVEERAITVFSDITANAKDKSEVVVSFLALLELVKQQIIIAKQSGVFKDIRLSNEQKVKS